MAQGRIGRSAQIASLAMLMLALAGCTHNPLLGTWTIASREKEVDTSFIDELTANTKSSSGTTTIEFLKDSIVTSGGPQSHTINGVSYIITELEGGATDVQIMQAHKDPDNNDVDVCHIDKTGNAASIESRNALMHLTRAGQ